MDLKSTVLTKGDIHDDINLMPPQMKRTLSGCIRRESLRFHVYVKEGSFEHWFLKDIELLCSLPSAPRRNLISERPPLRSKIRAPIFASDAAPETISSASALESSRFRSLRSSERQTEEDHGDGSRHMEIIIACATTAVMTFALVALLFFFCFTNPQNRISPEDEQKDDRPLLNLSSSAGMN